MSTNFFGRGLLLNPVPCIWVKCAAQPALEGGLPLEFPAVTPQVVGPSAEPSIDFPLKVMNIYKTNL